MACNGGDEPPSSSFVFNVIDVRLTLVVTVVNASEDTPVTETEGVSAGVLTGAVRGTTDDPEEDILTN